MAITQNWDTIGTFPATAPSGWNLFAGRGTTINAAGGTALTDASNGGTTAESTAADPYSGVVFVKARTFLAAVNVGFTYIGARLTGGASTYGMQAVTSGYVLEISTASSVYSTILHKWVAASASTIGTVTTTTGNFPYGAGYTWGMRIQGTSTTVIDIVCLRDSDSKWWDGSAWQTAFSIALTVTDSSSPITGAGLYGVEVNCLTAGQVTSDNFSIDVAVAVATGYNVTGPATGPVGVPSTNFVVTPNAATGGPDTVSLADGGASGVFVPSGLSFLSGATVGVPFTYQPASAGAKTLTPLSTLLSLPMSPTTRTYTAFTKVNADDANMNYSNVDMIGSGASAVASMLHPGSWLAFTVSGTTQVDVLMDCASQVSGPQMAYFVDDGPEVVVSLVTTGFSIAMTSASHRVFAYVDWTNQVTGVWPTPANAAARVTGLNLNGGLLTATSLPTDTALFITDSIGTDQYIGSGRAGGVRTHNTFPHFVGMGLNAIPCVVGWPGQGYDKVATATDVPPAFTPGNDTLSSYNKHSAGRPRVLSGFKYIFIVLGTNNTSGALLQASLTGLLTALRAANPSAWIFPVVAFNGAINAGSSLRSFYVAANAAYQAATPDSKEALIDLAIDNASTALNPFNAVSKYITEQAPHPNEFGHSRAAVKMVGAVKTIVDAVPASAQQGHFIGG